MCVCVLFLLQYRILEFLKAAAAAAAAWIAVYECVYWTAAALRAKNFFFASIFGSSSMYVMMRSGISI